MSNLLSKRLDPDDAWRIGVILFVVFSVLHSIIHFDFLEWDDSGYVTNNPLIRDFSLPGIFNVFQTGNVLGSYNPVVLLSWMIDYAIWGLNPIGFHLSNLSIHLLNCCLVYVLIVRWSQSSEVAFIVSLLFGLHPAQVEPVAWVSGRKDLLMVMFSLVSFIAHTHYSLKRSKGWYGIFLVAFVLAVMSKAVAVVLPIIIIAVDKFVLNKQVGLKQFVAKMPLFFLSLLFGIIAILGQIDAESFITGKASFFENQIIVLFSLYEYTVNSVVPINMSAVHPFPIFDQNTGAIYLGATLAIIGLSLGLLLLKKHRLMLFGLAFFILWLIPTLPFKPFGMSFIAGRFSYMAYIGLFLLFALALKKVKGSLPSRKHQVALSILVFTCIGFYANASHRYCKTWRNDKALWAQVLNTYQNHPLPLFKAGTMEVKSGNSLKALEFFNKSIEVDSSFASAYINRGMLLLENNQLQGALADFDRALGLDSTATLPLINRGVVLMGLNRYAEAKKTLVKALVYSGDLIDLVHFNLGEINALQGEYDSAVVHFKKASELKPNNARYLYSLAQSEALRGNLTEAEKLVLGRLKNEPKEIKFLILLSEINATKGEYYEALRIANYAASFGARLDSSYVSKLKNDELVQD